MYNENGFLDLHLVVRVMPGNAPPRTPLRERRSYVPLEIPMIE